MHLSSDLRALILSNTEKGTDSRNNAVLFKAALGFWMGGRVHTCFGGVCWWSLMRKLQTLERCNLSSSLHVIQPHLSKKTKQEQSGQHRDQCDVTFTVYLQSDCEETGLAW